MNLPTLHLPHNKEAEQALLSALLRNPACRAGAKEELSASDFATKSHQDLYKVITSDNLDLSGIHTELQRQGLLEKCGGKEYLMELATISSTTVHWPYYAKIIKDMAFRSRLIIQCLDTVEQAGKPSGDLGVLLAEHKEALRGFEPRKIDYATNRELVNQAYDIIGERHREEKHNVGIFTGYKNIDNYLHGMEPKTTFYLKGESGSGKSSLAMNIGENIVSAYQGSVLYFTLESTALALTFRRFARYTKIALTRIRTGNIRSEGEWENITKACNALYDNHMVLIEHSRFRWFEDIQAFCESFAINNKLLLVIIDFLQLMRSKTKHNSRHLELSYISDCLNFLAKDLDCPVLILSQVNKDYEAKESRDVENNADNVWEIKRETQDSELASLRATKGKDSGVWFTTLKFDRFIQRFYDCEEQYKAF